MLFKISTAYSILLILAGLAQASPVRRRETIGDLRLEARDNLALDTFSLPAGEVEDKIRLIARSDPGSSTPDLALSSQVTNPGQAQIAGGTVYYMYAAPTAPADLKNELQVLQSFLAAWNADTPDNPALAPNTPRQRRKRPSNTDAPPKVTRLLVTKSNHKSSTNASSRQAEHLSVYVVPKDGWQNNPWRRMYGAVVHVFPKNGDPAQGYQDYWIYPKRKRSVSGLLIAALTEAEDHNFGTLGQGTLA